MLAHRFAMENPAMIRAEGIESMEFPELSRKYAISSVPDTVINAIGHMVGSAPESHLLAEIKKVL